MHLARRWAEEARNWIAWARAAGHDSYWRFHRRSLLGLLPPPGNLTVDVGCGEGRVSRDLAEIGHRVVGLDLSAEMVRAATDHPSEGTFARGDAARLPLRDGAADLVVAFMSVQDMDEPGLAVQEFARVLGPGGRLHLAVVHPVNSAGRFSPGDDPERPFVISDSYLAHRLTTTPIERDGYRMVFESAHHPMQQYSQWLEQAGFLIERVREVGDPSPASAWHRVPLFLHMTATVAPWRPLDWRLFHIAGPGEADELLAAGERRPPSLEADGFVHLSRADQVVASTERHFPAGAELVLVELDPERVAADVRWPEVYPGERFPHLHGPLMASSVVQVLPWGPSDRDRWGR